RDKTARRDSLALPTSETNGQPPENPEAHPGLLRTGAPIQTGHAHCLVPRIFEIVFQLRQHPSSFPFLPVTTARGTLVHRHHLDWPPHETILVLQQNQLWFP